MYLSPKALIRLSLCSRYLRCVVVSDQHIWRIQYYKEWPAFFPSRKSTEDVLFPTPTWIQTFIARKISEMNIERKKVNKVSCVLRCKFFQDLMLHYSKYTRTLMVYKIMDQKVTELSDLDKFSVRHLKARCGKNVIIYQGRGYVYSLSMNNQYCMTDTDKIYNLFSINDTQFIGAHYHNATLFTLIAGNQIERENISFSKKAKVAQIYGRVDHCVVANKFGKTKKMLEWKIWDLRNLEKISTMTKVFGFKHKINKISSYFLADTDFIFIPFTLKDNVGVHVYSFKEDRAKFFRISGNPNAEIVVFYASAWCSMVSRSFYSKKDSVICISFSGTTLDSLVHSVLNLPKRISIRIVQISRTLLYIRDGDYFSSDCKFSVFDMVSKRIIWSDCEGFLRGDINSRYLVFKKQLWDFNPQNPPEIKDWLYKLFE